MINTKPPQLVSSDWEERDGEKVFVVKAEAIYTVEEVQAYKERVTAQHAEVESEKVEADAIVIAEADVTK